MLTINDKTFVKNDKEAIETLFKKSDNGTFHGYYKRTKRGIQLMNIQKELFAFVVNNYRTRNYFFVSASRLENKKIRYMYALTDKASKFLGIDKLRYTEELDLAERLIKETN